MPEDNVEETVVPVEEIDDMLGLEPAESPNTPADGTTEAPAGEASATAAGTPPEAHAEAPAADEPPATEAPAATVPVVSIAAPQAPLTPAQDTELQIAQKQNEQLRLQLNELAKMGLTIPLPTAQTSPTQSNVPIVPVTPIVAPAASAPQPAASWTPQPIGSLQDIITKLNSDQNYLTEEDLDNIVDNPSLINVAINKAVRGSTEQLIQAIPLIAAGIANQQIVLNNMAIDFYETNSDLAPYKEFVSAIAKQVEASNTGKTYNEIFNLTATQVRERLGLKVSSPQAPAPSGVTPAFAGTRGPARPPVASKQTDDMVTQIAELLL